MQKATLEIIGFNVESCVLAQAAGADRIELCASPDEGGTTPSHGFIAAARKALQIQLYPIIRPRGGDFLYSDYEFETMLTDVQLCKQLGCDGVVIGMLQADGSIDRERCSRLVALAYPMGVTFHRAFDRCNKPMEALETIIDIGCERILTSGQYPDAGAGSEMLAALVQQAADRIVIMPGSGIRSSNIIDIAQKTGATEFHSSARKMIDSVMQYQPASMQERLQSVSVDSDEIKSMAQQLQAYFKEKTE